MKKKILVTGGAGYIGSHTVVALYNAGYEPIIIDDFSNAQEEMLERIAQVIAYTPKHYAFTLCDRRALQRFFEHEPHIEAVIHFAASKAVGESVERPLLYYYNNLVSLINLLEEMPNYKVNTIVFSSSCTVYGQPKTLPVTEKSPVLPAESPYGNTKQIAEEILRDTCRANDALNAVALRYFNPVGAHESARIGELPQGVPNNLVPFITQTASGIREKLLVFGNDYNTPDGSCIRDYIHVTDLAKAHVAAVDRMLKKRNEAAFEVFNLGAGKGSSVLEVIRTFEEVNQLSVNYEIVARRPGDIEQIWADTSLANEALQWKAEKDLAEMMRSAWAWEKHFRAL